MIPQETVDQIMNAAVIEEVVGDYVELKKSGSSLRGLSPSPTKRHRRFTCSSQGHFQMLLERQGRQRGDFFDGAGKGQLS